MEHTKEKASLVWDWRVFPPFTCNDSNTEGCHVKIRKQGAGGGRILVELVYETYGISY